MQILIKTAILILILAGLTTAARAGDLALVITNGASDARRHVDLVAAYDAQGFEVIGGRELDQNTMQDAVSRFLGQAKDADRVIVHFSGRSVYYRTQTWLLPIDIQPDSLAVVGYNTTSANLLLDVLGDHAGRAILLIANENSDRVRRPLRVGFGDFNVPQGVLLISGNEPDVNDFVQRELLVLQGTVAEVLAATSHDVKAQGFVSPDLGIARNIAVVSTANWVDVVAEQALWAVAENSGSQVDLEEYLRRFPSGLYAAAARARLSDLVAPTPETVEAALNLTRTERISIQKNLTVLGFDTRGIDGIFGSGTRASIAAWQKDQALEQTGYLRERLVTKLQRQSDTRRREIKSEDRAYWQATGASDDKVDLQTYLEKYPAGEFADKATEALRVFEAAETTRADQRAWRQARELKTAAGYGTYLGAFPDGLYRDIAQERLAEMQPTSPDPSDEAMAIAQENRLGLNAGTRTLIETRLSGLDYNVGPIDGTFTDQTRRGIKAFQRDRRIEATGYVDSATVRALLQ